MCVSPLCASVSVFYSSVSSQQLVQAPLFLTAVASTITVACIIFAMLQDKVQWRNARSYTKVNNFIWCLKYVSLRLCKAAHRHSRVGLKERLLINERGRLRESKGEKLSLPQFSFKQALPTGLHCLD